jgi:hypothetical protein
MKTRSTKQNLCVQFITPDSVPPLIAQPIIHLVLAEDGVLLINQLCVCLRAPTQKGVSFWYDGVNGLKHNKKLEFNKHHCLMCMTWMAVSFGNRVKYPSSTFTGSKLFSYAVGDTGILDPILQFPLQY